MSCDRILFAARGAEAERRLAAVVRYYEPCGAGAPRVARHGDVVVGALPVASFDQAAAPVLEPAGGGDGLVESFGERLPQALETPAALLAAGDGELRALDGFHAAVAATSDGRVRLVGGAGAPRTWFAAGDAYATTAAAAALLGGGPAEVDPDALPELLALGACLGDRTHLRGVRALPIATVVDLPAGGERTFWPRQERWAAVDERAAGDAGWRALLDTLDRRVRGERAPWLAVTAGRDSPVVAAAARELGLPLRTFTWGEEHWPDVAGGRAVAQAYGLEHRHQPLRDVEDPEEARRLAVREALWADGAAALGGYALPTLPADMSVMVTGAGAEVARAYYYHWAARSRPRPRRRDLIATLGPLERVPATHRDAVGAALDEWFDGAAAAGHPGWTALDVFYAEERMGRWGRARVARHPSALLTPFPSPEVARALVSLPFDERLTLAWHRRVATAVALPDQRDQRRGIPAPLRRLASSLRRGQPSAATPWPAAGVWERLPQLREWVLEEPLGAPLLLDALGDEWLASMRDGLRAGTAPASDQALLAAAAMVVDARLGELKLA